MPVTDAFYGPSASAAAPLIFVHRANPDIAAQGRAQAEVVRATEAATKARHDKEAETARYPTAAKQERFGVLFPWMKDQFGSLDSQLSRAGGQQVGNAPEITAAPVYSNQQIQQRVNAQTAANNQQTENQFRQLQQETGSRGYGSRSPMLAALGVQMGNQNMATNTANARETRLNAANVNAQQLLRGQQAQQQQFEGINAIATANRAPIYQRQNALLAAMSGLA